MGSNDWLLEAWIKEFADVLQMMTGLEFYPSMEDGAVPNEDGQVWWAQPLSLSPDHPVLIGTRSDAAADIGHRSLQAAGVPKSDEEAALGTYLELVQQAMAGFARMVSQRVGRPVECQAGHKEADRPATAVRVELRCNALELAPVYVHLPPIFRALTADVGTAMAVTPHPPSGRWDLPNPVELLLDVEMPVSISFGRTHLPLRDVLKFAVGSVIELNRHPEEPVEVVVNNCVIARGEVVVIDGNYGVRIQQIMSRQQRMALREQERAALVGR